MFEHDEEYYLANLLVHVPIRNFYCQVEFQVQYILTCIAKPNQFK